MTRIGIVGSGLGLGHGGVPLTGGGDPAAIALIAAMTTPPDATRQTLISITIAALRTAGIWDELDECWFMAAATEQAGLLGWKRYKDLLAVNAPTFTANQGFASNGTTSYLNTQFVPSTDGVQYLQNDASLGIYVRTNVANSNMLDFGARVNSSTAQARINSRNASDQLTHGINNDTTISYANTDSRSLFAVRRSGATAANAYRNGVEIGTSTQASTTPPAYAFYICAVNEAGTAINLSTRQVAFAFVGASMTPTQQASLFTIVEAYMDAIGAGVVA